MSDDDALKLMPERLAQIPEVAERCRVYLAIEPDGDSSLLRCGLDRVACPAEERWSVADLNALSVLEPVLWGNT